MANIDPTKKLSTESYKGVRDFYPTDMFVQNYIFNTWRKTVELFGYEEYTASILENTEIYKAKSGQELVNDQTYTFTDRGDREVTLRPEMTPSLARIVASRKRELGFPLRLFSIPNCFRYERPQRGRMREFWQLNVDLLTKKTSPAYVVEVLKLINNIMKDFGATEKDYTVKVNSRLLMNALYERYYNFTPEQALSFSKIIDKKDKVTAEEFNTAIKTLTNKEIVTTENIVNISEVKTELDALMQIINSVGVTNIIFDLNIVRGFDYYTGVVFEVFDNDTQNNRALFGGGQYDDLVDLFEGAVDEPVSGIGFGIGDVPMMNFLESRNLLPEYNASASILVGVLDESSEVVAYADVVATELRSKENVAVVYTAKKYGDLAKLAQKLGIKKLVVVGADEVKEKKYEVKEV